MACRTTHSNRRRARVRSSPCPATRVATASDSRQSSMCRPSLLREGPLADQLDGVGGQLRPQEGQGRLGEGEFLGPGAAEVGVEVLDGDVEVLAPLIRGGVADQLDDRIHRSPIQLPACADLVLLGRPWTRPEGPEHPGTSIKAARITSPSEKGVRRVTGLSCACGALRVDRAKGISPARSDHPAPIRTQSPEGSLLAGSVWCGRMTTLRSEIRDARFAVGKPRSHARTCLAVHGWAGLALSPPGKRDAAKRQGEGDALPGQSIRPAHAALAGQNAAPHRAFGRPLPRWGFAS